VEEVSICRARLDFDTKFYVLSLSMRRIDRSGGERAFQITPERSIGHAARVTSGTSGANGSPQPGPDRAGWARWSSRVRGNFIAVLFVITLLILASQC
jgi:hypothetical protein